MQLTNIISLLALIAAGASALPEPVANMAEDIVERDSGNLIEARCKANLPNCQGASYIGDDKCKCQGQIAPCGNWKCGWNGPKSILNCGSKGSGCQWIN
ncbi:hypothetical protein C8A01DRAFT_42270 [Parachaetomium inaequale]|uniref:Uncharacterized protein n=1 Tax=Parachaetomium inaequale TaxID=2588326 RepID=A0AAN6P7N8_9PEZI|nr:hypothetical protein C8A01DRAFT_42270 [Parachaetomium inaequale]